MKRMKALLGLGVLFCWMSLGVAVDTTHLNKDSIQVGDALFFDASSDFLGMGTTNPQSMLTVAVDSTNKGSMPLMRIAAEVTPNNNSFEFWGDEFNSNANLTQLKLINRPSGNVLFSMFNNKIHFGNISSRNVTKGSAISGIAKTNLPLATVFVFSEDGVSKSGSLLLRGIGSTPVERQALAMSSGIPNAGILKGGTSDGTVLEDSHGNQLKFGYEESGTNGYLKWLFTPATGTATTVYMKIQNATSFSKTFVIDHPTRREQYLVHGAIEGPESAVAYYGQGRLVNGKAIVTLPNYFEGLTRKKGRTVRLTPIDGFDRLTVESDVLGNPVKNGQFIVYSDNPESDQVFDWEVKAIRKDVAPLNVEPKKSDVKVDYMGPYSRVFNRSNQ